MLYLQTGYEIRNARFPRPGRAAHSAPCRARVLRAHVLLLLYSLRLCRLVHRFSLAQPGKEHFLAGSIFGSAHLNFKQHRATSESCQLQSLVTTNQ